MVNNIKAALDALPDDEMVATLQLSGLVKTNPSYIRQNSSHPALKCYRRNHPSFNGTLWGNPVACKQFDKEKSKV